MKPEPSEPPRWVTGPLARRCRCGGRRRRSGGRNPRSPAAAALALDLDALPGRDVDHRRLEPLGEVGEAHRRAARGGAGGDGARLVLRGLRADRVEGQGRGGAAEEDGAGDAVDVTHVRDPSFIFASRRRARPASSAHGYVAAAERDLNDCACGPHRLPLNCRRYSLFGDRMMLDRPRGLSAGRRSDEARSRRTASPGRNRRNPDPG